MKLIQTALNNSLVIIPTFNEKENISDIIDTVLALDAPFDVLVVDDNSPDGTASIVKQKIKEDSNRIQIIERKGKHGLGTAYIEGLNMDLKKGMTSFLKWMPIFHITLLI